VTKLVDALLLTVAPVCCRFLQLECCQASLTYIFCWFNGYWAHIFYEDALCYTTFETLVGSSGFIALWNDTRLVSRVEFRKDSIDGEVIDEATAVALNKEFHPGNAPTEEPSTSSEPAEPATDQAPKRRRVLCAMPSARPRAASQALHHHFSAWPAPPVPCHSRPRPATYAPNAFVRVVYAAEHTQKGGLPVSHWVDAAAIHQHLSACRHLLARQPQPPSSQSPPSRRWRCQIVLYL
jgi:hypothetical protein